MNIELVAYSQANPALDPADLLEMSDLATIWNGASTYPENVIEYAGRVCYRSTHRMGTAPRFIVSRVREGHEDIIEHIVATVRVRNSEEPLRWRMLNRHCEVTQEADGSWLVSANTRVWLDLFRHGIGLQALPFLQFDRAQSLRRIRCRHPKRQRRPAHGTCRHPAAAFHARTQAGHVLPSPA